MDIAELKQKSVAELHALAAELNITNYSGLRKQDLIFRIEQSLLDKDTVIRGEGVLEILPEGYGFLRSRRTGTTSTAPTTSTSRPSQIKRFDLRTGDTIMGQVRPPKEGERYLALLKVESVNYEEPEKTKHRIAFDNLKPRYPDQRIRLERKNSDLSMRVVDLLSPIGKGQRGLIVAPPKAGKTILLQKLANAITENHPECYLIVLLIDERPEEVTDMQENVAGGGDRLDLRRAGRPPRAGGRHGDREGASAWSSTAATWSSCSTRSPAWPGPTTWWCRTPARSSPAAWTPTRCRSRSGSSAPRATSRAAARSPSSPPR